MTSYVSADRPVARQPGVQFPFSIESDIERPLVGPGVLLPAIAVSIGLLAAFVLRSRLLQRTGWALPPEPRGGEVAKRHDLKDEAAAWRMIEEHMARQKRSSRDG